MSLFSDKLSYYIKKSRLTLLHLSSVSGFDVSYLSKIKKGERLPRNKDVLVPLINGLRLSPAEKQDLWDAYKISSIGEEKFKQYQAIGQFLTSVNSADVSSINYSFQHTIQSPSVCYGKTDINNVVKAVLESEASRENGYIHIVAQPNYQFLMDTLTAVGLNRPGLEITHIICLQSGSGNSKLVYNIECFQSVFPLLNFKSYCVKYYYDDIPSHINGMNVMPFFLQTSEYTILLSDDYTLADISNNKSRHGLYSHMFRNMLSYTSDFIIRRENFLLYSDLFSEASQKRLADIVEFSPLPCLLPYYPEKVLKEIIKPDTPGYEEKTDFLISYCRQFRETLDRSTNFFCLFSYEGLLRFLQTGYMPGIPADICRPIKTSDTILVLKKLCARQEIKNHIPLMLKPECIGFNERMRILYDASSDILLFLSGDPGLGHSCFCLKEQSLASSVEGFLKYLTDSDETYTSAETTKFLQKQISILENKRQRQEP